MCVEQAPLDEHIILWTYIYVGSEVVVKAKKLTKAGMAKKSSHDWNIPNGKKQRKGRWVIIRKTKKGKEKRTELV